MKQKIKGGHLQSRRGWIQFALALFLLVIAGCTKVAPAYTLKVPANNPDTTRDVRSLLDSLPGFSLFDQAIAKAALRAQLDPADFYTLFVPTDSAMKAAGLTADVINALPPDSLAAILQYHITYGGVSDTLLVAATVSIRQNSLLESVYFQASPSPNAGYSSYRHALFVKYYQGLLNINGWAVNTGQPPVRASNGYIYAINQVLRPPSLLLWDLVNTRPELSYYKAAIDWMDSVYKVLNYGQNFALSDSSLFVQLRLEPVNGAVINTPSMRPTVFAPTNTAFINAGFPDIPALQNYLVNSMRVDTIYPDPVNNPSYYVKNNVPGQGYQLLSNGGLNSIFNYFPFDSVLKMHYLYNVNQQASSSNGSVIGLSFTDQLCYSDLTGSPSINNGVLNATTLNTTNGGIITPYRLQFASTAGGQLNIRWNPAGTYNAIIPQDSSQETRQRNFWALNGVIYESDRLFFKP